MVLRWLPTILSLFWCIMLNAQYQVEFVLKERTTIKHDSIFIVGSFNGWDSLSNTDYLMQPLDNGDKVITLTLGPGTIEYKFHRGSWLTVEKAYNGNEIQNRLMTINQDTSLNDSVEAWRDLIHLDKKVALAREKTDAGRARLLAAIARSYAFTTEFYNVDSAFLYSQQAIDLQQKILQSGEYDLDENPDYFIRLIRVKEIVASLLHSLGNYPKALEIRLENFEIAENTQDQTAIIYTTVNLAEDYASMKDYRSVLTYTKSAESLLSLGDTKDLSNRWLYLRLFHSIAETYYNLGQLDSALIYANKVKGLVHEPLWKIWNDQLMGDILAAKGDHQSAFTVYRRIIPDAANIYAARVIAMAHTGIAKLFLKENKIDSALHYARKAFTYYQNNEIEVQSWGENSDRLMAEISPIIAESYQKAGQLDSAYKYLNLSVRLKDDLYNTDKVRQFQTLTFNEEARRQELAAQARQDREAFQNQVKIYGLITILVGILILTIILYANNKRKQKLNATLHKQKHEIESTLEELKNTQSQLIHAEKMASLGELTAGIAHEIQNPLNFVNNFSEVNSELIDELTTEIENQNWQEVKAMAEDIKANENKIAHHGKRADGIVKSMLQHSRNSLGEMQLTDINLLIDEYSRLAYHGMRARHKTFNADLKTNFDDSLEKVEIKPQEIGRVLINIITNAFHAVMKRKAEGNYEYQPQISISTKNLKDKLEIRIKDNGPGIPDNIKDKIFQPFFTTKPTGEGTGLGLSLSYDIIKAHGGTLEVNTKFQEGTEMLIILPTPTKIL